jgi:cyanate permease
MMMLIAYPIGAIGPLILGAVKDATGSFAFGYAIILTLAILTFLTIPIFRPGRHIDDYLVSGEDTESEDDGQLPIPPV